MTTYFGLLSELCIIGLTCLFCFNNVAVTSTIPALGRKFTLGSLYDVRNERLVYGKTIWKQSTIDESTQEKIYPYTETQFITGNSLNSKLEAFRLSPEIEASLFAGLIKVEGAANILDSQSSSNRHEAVVTFHYYHGTHSQKLTSDALHNLDYQDMEVSHEATHVVTGIDYGANVMMRFITKANATSKKDMEDLMKNKIAVALRWPTGTCTKVGVQGSLRPQIAENQNYTSSLCQFYGDVYLEKPPTTYEEAIETYQYLPGLINKSTTVPITVHLTPLSDILSTNNKLVYETDLNLLKDIKERMISYDKLVQKIDDMKQLRAYDLFPLLKKHISSSIDAVDTHRNNFKMQLKNVLPNIRSGEDVTEKALGTFINGQDQISTLDNLAQYVTLKQKECAALDSLLAYFDTDPSLVVSKPEDRERLFSDDKIDYILSLDLYLYPEQETFTECIRHQCGLSVPNSTKCSELSCENGSAYKSWYNHKIVSSLHEIISKFKTINEHMKILENSSKTYPQTISIIREKPRQTDDPKFAVNIYHKFGKNPTKNFTLPSIGEIKKIKRSCDGTIIQWKIEVSDSSSKWLTSDFIVNYRRFQSEHWTELLMVNAGAKEALIPLTDDFEVIVSAICNFGVCAGRHERFESNKQSKLDCPITSPVGILLIGGNDNKAMQSMEYYYPDNLENNQLANVSMSVSRFNHISVLLEQRAEDKLSLVVHSAGGESTWFTHPNCESFDLLRNKVNFFNGCHFRVSAGSTTFDGVGYQCGGKNHTADKASCERLRFGSWDDIAPMPTARNSLSMAAHNGELYAIGGSGRKETLKTVEKYTINLDKWTTMKPMQLPRAGASAVFLNGILYVCGGYADDNEKSNCEQYNMNSFWNKWTFLTEMNFKRSWFSLVTDGNRLFALGGLSSPRTVEEYDFQSGKWTVSSKQLIYKRYQSTAVVIRR